MLKSQFMLSYGAVAGVNSRALKMSGGRHTKS